MVIWNKTFEYEIWDLERPKCAIERILVKIGQETRTTTFEIRITRAKWVVEHEERGGWTPDGRKLFTPAHHLQICPLISPAI
jgi:hypothetical protein